MKSKILNKKCIRKISTNSIINKQQMIYKTDLNYLFYHFLIHDKKIDLFENSKDKKLMNTIQRSFDSYNLYLLFIKMNKEYIWNNFQFSFIIFKVLYHKAKKLRKKIIKYANNKKIEINELFESYNPERNIFKLNEYNWNIPIENSYLKLQKKKIREARIRIDNESKFFEYFKTNFLILTREKVKNKKLIFSGNLCNVYLEDINMRNKNKNLNNSQLYNNEKIISVNGISTFRKKSNNKNSNSSFKSSFIDKNISNRNINSTHSSLKNLFMTKTTIRKEKINNPTSLKQIFINKTIKNRNKNIGTHDSFKNIFMNSTISNKNNDNNNNNNNYNSLKNLFMNKTISNRNKSTSSYTSLKNVLLNQSNTNRNKNNYISLKKKMLKLGNTNFNDEINKKNIKDTDKKSNLIPCNSFNKPIKMKKRINLKHNMTNISSEKKFVNFYLNKSDFFYN